MTLKRYNDVLVAVVGTGLLLGVPVLILQAYLSNHSYQPPAGVTIDAAGAAKTHIEQSMGVCSPILAGC